MTATTHEFSALGIGEDRTLKPDTVLESAKGRFDMVVVIGRKTTGGAPYVASSHGEAEALAEIEVAKHWMLAEIAAARGW